MIAQNVKVSVVIPVFNAENTIGRTLASLCDQTLREIEIICVLDKPTDNSASIVKAMAEKDDRIVVIENDRNLGVSGSRNIGIQHACGQYIGFSDNDDFQERDMYKVLYETIVADQSDICVSDTWIDFRGEATVAEIHPVCAEHFNIPSDVSDISILSVYKDPTKEGIIRDLLLPENLMENFLSRDVWASLYRRSFIEDNGIFFPDRSKFNEEDTLFNLMSYSKARQVSYCNKPFYHWCRQSDSQASAKFSHSEAVDKILNMVEMKWKILEDNNCKSYYRKDFWIGLSYYIRRYYSVIKNFDISRKHRLHELFVCSDFPILGKYYDMKLVSKIRVKLFFLVIRLKYFTN